MNERKCTVEGCKNFYFAKGYCQSHYVKNRKKKKAKMKKDKYTNEDKNCAHCGGNLSPHGTFNGVIIWCDDCGSNSPKNPPNVGITFTK